MSISVLVPQVLKVYVMPSASVGQDSRSGPPSAFTASRPASRSASSDVILDAIAKLVNDRISLLQHSHNALRSQFSNLRTKNH